MFTHKQLVDITAEKCEKLFGCGLVLKEPQSMKLSFIPDVFSVKKEGITFQFEIKISRADFLKDQHKKHRQDPLKDVGLFRYYVVPFGMISSLDPLLDLHGAKWGLITVDKGGQFRILRGPNPRKNLKKFSDGSYFEYECQRDCRAEMELVYSYYRGLVCSSQGEMIKVGSIAERIYNSAEELKNTCVKMR